MRLGLAKAALAMLAALGAWRFGARADPPVQPAPSPRVPVIVELFSSEGCSSCPPADAYLASLDRTQPVDGVAVIALEEHVDYWDRLGWRDPFGSAAFSARQSQYARVLDDHGVFTPEIVIDGHYVMPGGDEDTARVLMQRSAREPRARVMLRREGARVGVDVAGVPPSAPADVPEVWLALTESDLASDVRAGENAGHRLAHAPVVRRLQLLGRATAGSFRAETVLDADPAWAPRALRVVVFVQLAQSRRITGAAVL